MTFNEDKIILDLCGGTGAWSKPYKDAGYDVRLITLPEHDVRTYQPPDKVYGILAAPPCTHFSFARTVAKMPRDTRGGIELVKACLNIIWECQHKTKRDTDMKPPLAFWALENPFGRLNWFLGDPVYIFHPYEYGHGYSKRTCLWGHFKQPKSLALYSRKYRNKFDRLLMSELEEIRSISNLTFGKKNRQELRSITPELFAKAFYEVNK
jgi:hypothetical protein